MSLVTFNMNDKLKEQECIKNLIKDRKLSKTINDLLAQYINMDVEEIPAPFDEAQMMLPSKEFDVLKYLLINRVTHYPLIKLVDKIYDAGFIRQKKKIKESIERVVKLSKMYQKCGLEIESTMFKCDKCSAQLSPLALKHFRCPQCDNLIVKRG